MKALLKLSFAAVHARQRDRVAALKRGSACTIRAVKTRRKGHFGWARKAPLFIGGLRLT